MERRLVLLDTTLRDGEQAPGCSMDLYEKLEVARALAALRVDIIEAGFPVSSQNDFDAVRRIADEVRTCTIAGLARAVPGDIDRAWEALRGAEAPLIHIFLATSERHMRNKLRMTPEEVITRAKDAVRYARTLCAQVQFSAEDASRSDPDFLCRVFGAVIQAGATTVNLADTVGYLTPEEAAGLIRHVRAETPGIDNVRVGIHCHNDLGLAVANSLSAAAVGADQIEGTLNGIGERAGNAALEEIVMALHTRRTLYQISTQVNTRQIYQASKTLETVIHSGIAPNKPIVGENIFKHESGIHQHGVLVDRQTYEILAPEEIGVPQSENVLGRHSGRHAFAAHLSALGYVGLQAERVDELFAQFKRLTEKKKNVTDKDIIALAGRRRDTVPVRFKLESFVINSGNTIPATARITLATSDGSVDCVAVGDGPVDAAFKAINSAAGHIFELQEYTIRAVTEGEDALGEATIRLSLGERRITTRGISTDIIEASLKAYINGVNRLLNEER